MSHVLVITGAKEDDYEAEEEPAPTESSTKKDEAGNETEEDKEGKEERGVSDIGSISFVSCATGEDAMTSLGGNQEAEEGNYICPHIFCSCFFLSYFFSILLFIFFRGQDKTDKRNSR